MQYTGLKDKNGVYIFEGDFLDPEEKTPLLVGWKDKFASFILDKQGWAFSHYFGEGCNPKDCTVIGNKFENTELFLK